MQKSTNSIVFDLKKDNQSNSSDNPDNNQQQETSQSTSNNEMSARQTKALAILLGLFSVLLLIAFVSYSSKDDINVQISVFDLLTGSESARVKVETTHNWLGILGAVLADFFYNGTIGYSIILLPFFLLYLSKDIFVGNGLTDVFFRRFGIYLILAGLVACLLATMQNISWFIGLPKEFTGAIGAFLATMLSKIVGTVGAFLIFSTAIGITIFLGFDINISKIPVLSFISKKWKDIKSKYITNKEVSETPEDIPQNQEEDSIDIPSEEPVSDTLEDDDEEIIDNNEKETFEPATIINRNKEINPEIADVDDNIEEALSDKIKTNAEDNIKEPEPPHPPKENPHTKKSNALKTLLDGNSISSVIDDEPQKEKVEEDNIESKPDNQEIKDINDIVSEHDEDEKSEIEEKPLNISYAEPEPIKDKTTIIDDDDNDDSYYPISTKIHDEKILYRFPDESHLDRTISENEVSPEELEMNARILQEKLETFKIYIENLTVTPGPVVTQYEFVPAAGIKISKIESLADDLAMALKAPGIRIIAPIPGKGTVGVEIPNSKPQVVRFYENISSDRYNNTKHALPLALGKTINGEIYITDLAKMPHLLIAGSTGSGKSVGINTVISSLLYKKHPSELKFVIVDPKKVELQQYSQLEDHFLAVSPDIKEKIITDPKNAVIALKAAVLEMEKRYDILAEAGQRNIKDYNRKVAEGKMKNRGDIAHRPMPYIVVIIDELADLMLTAGKEVEEPITRLAQMARAVGIHLIVATQRPSVDVITGLIKANFPARIAYLVATKIDSRTILDMPGAEKLLGMGDMLILPPGSPKPIRIQNAFISTDEVDNICEFIGEQTGYSTPYQLPSLNDNDGSGDSISAEDRDPLFGEAARLIVRNQQGSVSLIQRRLKVGYARAGRIVDELEDAGIVGPFTGSKARDVLLESESELEAIL